MKFRGKEVRVILSKEAKHEYDELKILVEEEQNARKRYDDCLKEQSYSGDRFEDSYV